MFGPDRGYTLTNDQKRRFFSRMIAIAVPVIIQNIITMSLGVADTIMIGKLGEEQIAGVGAANQLFMISWSVIFGFYSGATAHSAQYWGAGDIKKTRYVLGMDYIVGASAGLVTIMISLLIPDKLLWFFARDTYVISYGVEYMKIACFADMFAFISFAFIFNSRVIQRLKMVTALNCGSLIINVFMNYVLIFGKFGAPALGVRGAAFATLIARILELLAVIIYISIARSHPLRGGIKEIFGFDRSFFKKVAKTALPVVFTETILSTISSATFAIYGILGASALAVIQVAEVIASMAQVMFFGLGNASAVLIGGALGVNDDRTAYEYAVINLKLGCILNALTCIFIITIARPVSHIYDFDPETIELLIKVIYIWGVITIPKMMNYVFICGILRAGGDTLYTLRIEFIGNLLVQIPLAIVAVVIFKMQLPLAILFVSVSDIVKLIMCIKRFKSRKWINMYNASDKTYEEG